MKYCLSTSVLSSSFTFLLFNASRDVNITFHAIKVVSHESRMPKLLRFLPSEITLFMLNTPNERASLESFFGNTYSGFDASSKVKGGC